MDVDGSGAAQNFDYVVPAGTVYVEFAFSRLNIALIDTNIRWGQFGGLGGALANGVLLQVLDENLTVLQAFGTDVEPLTMNENFIDLAGADSIISPAAGDDALPIRFSVFKSGNMMSMLPNWRVRMVVQDNLTGLAHFHAMVQGYLRRNPTA